MHLWMRKERAAGRRGRTGQHQAAAEQVRETGLEMPVDQSGQKPSGGAFGKEGRASRKHEAATQGAGGGGGGGENTPAGASHLNTGTSRRKARKRS